MPKRKPLTPADCAGTKKLHQFWKKSDATGLDCQKLQETIETAESSKSAVAGDAVPDSGQTSAHAKSSPPCDSTDCQKLHKTTGDADSGQTSAHAKSSPPCSSGEISDCKSHLKPVDIGVCIGNLPQKEADRFRLLTQHVTPSRDFDFPATKMHKKKRRFQRQWLDLYPWLVYSPAVDGSFCKYCALFATGDNLGQLVTVPYPNWNKCSDELKKHAEKKYHSTATMKAENFVTHMNNHSAAIDVQLDQDADAQIAVNRQILFSIFQIVLLGGKQGLALRGHRDDGILTDENNSNFSALLKFRIDSRVEVLKRHLGTCDNNATYISKETQNKLIQILGDQARGKLLAEIREAKFFSILADEVTDCSNWEQLSIALRFVDSSQQIREVFLGFVQRESITGEKLAGVILKCLEDWDLDVANCRAV